MIPWLIKAWWTALTDTECRARWTLRRRLYVVLSITFSVEGFSRYVLNTERD